MRILLNFLPIHSGGGLQNAVNFWLTCQRFENKDFWLGIARKGSEIGKLTQDANHIIQELKVSANYFLRFISDNLKIRKLVKSYRIDVVFTLAGPGPLKGQFIAINGWHEPAFVYPESVYWKRISVITRIRQKLKYMYSGFILKKADAIIVQTKTMKNRMVIHRKLEEGKLFIVPNGITTYHDEGFLEPEKAKILSRIKDRIKLLVLTEPWVHKNFEYLLKLAAILSDRYVFCLSFNQDTNHVAARFVQAVKKQGLMNKFVFLGRVQLKEIKKIYQKVDAVFLPTLLESFSANYVEAMYFNKPIFTSDLDFAREICGSYAYYFDPLDEKYGLEVLTNHFENNKKQEFASRIIAAKMKYPDWKERFDLYYKIIKRVVYSKS